MPLTTRQRSARKRKRAGLPPHATEACRLARTEAIEYYGGKCAVCGISEHRFLTLDHIKNDGARHRRRAHITGSLAWWAKAHGFPAGLQVLCMNHNHAKHRSYLESLRSKSAAAERGHRRRAVLRAEILDHYGNTRCRCCGEENETYLVLRHDKPATHRRKGKGSVHSGYKWYSKLRARGFPSGYHIECWNCVSAQWSLR